MARIARAPGGSPGAAVAEFSVLQQTTARPAHPPPSRVRRSDREQQFLCAPDNTHYRTFIRPRCSHWCPGRTYLFESTVHAHLGASSQKPLPVPAALAPRRYIHVGALLTDVFGSLSSQLRCLRTGQIGSSKQDVRPRRLCRARQCFRRPEKRASGCWVTAEASISPVAHYPRPRSSQYVVRPADWQGWYCHRGCALA